MPDPDAGRGFYSAVLGWDIPPGFEEFGGYSVASSEAGLAAGIGPKTDDGPTVWMLSFASADADATVQRITESGGTILAPTMTVGDFGRLAVAADPTGAVFGVWQADQNHGFAAPGTPGQWTWCDLRSTDPAVAQDFYAAVFGYEYESLEMAGPDYRTFSVGGGGPLGGMGPMWGAPEGTPSHWLVYFAVPDLDAAVAAVVAGGGTALGDPFDTPFGRMGPITDPFGAPLWLTQPPRSDEPA